MSNKYVKLASKRRERPKASFVLFEGVQMTAIEREALLRQRAAKRKLAEAMQPIQKPTVSKGQIVAPPTPHPASNTSQKKKQGLLEKLFGKKKKAPDAPRPTSSVKEDIPQEQIVMTETTVVETIKTTTEPVVEEILVEAVETQLEDVHGQECACTDSSEGESLPSNEEAAIHEAMAVEEAVEATMDEPEQEEVVIVRQTEEEIAVVEQVVQLYQKLKRTPKLELLRFARQTAAGADKAIMEHKDIAAELEAKEAQIKASKTPKDATEEQRKELNAKRAAMRKERDALKRQGLIAYEKAVSLERASDEYSAVASWLLEKKVDYRKQPRLNPVDSNLSENIIPLSEKVAHSSVPGVSKERIEELKERL